MYIIVVGGGKVGYYLAKELVEEGNEVLIIEKDAAKAERIAEELGDISLRGDGCEASTMEMAGFGRADMVIAVTGDDEDNLVTCQVAKAKFKVPRTIARINNPKNEEIFKKLGIDTTVSATTAILSQIEQELPAHPLIPLITLKGGGLAIVEGKVPENSAAVGKRRPLAFLGPPGTFSEEAALRYDPEAQHLPFVSISAVAAAVDSGMADEGIVPIENSLEGSVTETLDVLIHH